ncbi:MAG: hypothetical protein ACRYHQ_20140 [Janthinobacterium lividum]
MQQIKHAISPDELDIMRKFFEDEQTPEGRAADLDKALRAKADAAAEERDRRNSRQKRRDAVVAGKI